MPVAISQLYIIIQAYHMPKGQISHNIFDIWRIILTYKVIQIRSFEFFGKLDSYSAVLNKTGTALFLFSYTNF